MNLKKKNNDIVLEEVWCENGAGSTLPLLKYPLLEQTGIVEHCFTTRIGGVSKGIYESLNLSFTRGDEDAAVRENFRRLAGAMETDVSEFVFTDQTHTTNVRRVTAEDAGKGIVKERDYTDIDGLITNEPGLVLSTFYADCVPLYFVDPVHRAIGMSHSGWKGTVGKMGAATITAMKREFGTEAKDLVCAIGPSICQDCYEVSGDVIQQFRENFDEAYWPELFYKKENGKYQLDLWRANERIFTEAGIREDHIAVTNVCTHCNPDILFSHRTTGDKRGNVSAFLALKQMTTRGV